MQVSDCDCGSTIAEVLPMIQGLIDHAQVDCYVRDNKRLTSEQVFSVAEFFGHEVIERLVGIRARLEKASPVDTTTKPVDVPL
jgi:hypothetical protein